MNTPTPSNPQVARKGSGEMFDAIASRYDRLNAVISFGQHASWRHRLVAALRPAWGQLDEVLDLATGTADVAIEIAKTYRARVVGVDPSEGMMVVGREKVARHGLSEQVCLIDGDAQDLPFDDQRFDACCIAFGIRNVPDRPKALAEMRRVTRPGGVVAVLELAQPTGNGLALLARAHIKFVMPILGGLLSSKEEYDYLRESIAAFPKPEAFCQLMREAGLVRVAAKPYSFGALQLFTSRVE
ncbi:MAG: bifunctional demethylmenaquinone methyltransferase/2-methoxy-6-polyprenyl-1,4-benzoquinol methylase UbiE [Deltaproteobacteria bacterium CG17_big_fil_post_rev_8_21_14_2_50_63_7]|nr:MAG: bifunctional demethylmenaquinone methyltransferase/2-methoxy-6-polyprenyl-1,4-benzoquinol methylase UbiE [Deltaproteobacteria bacterium CG17_big_fil_post_rev_8_21_14_2_50_63_7]